LVWIKLWNSNLANSRQTFMSTCPCLWRSWMMSQTQAYVTSVEFLVWFWFHTFRCKSKDSAFWNQNISQFENTLYSYIGYISRDTLSTECVGEKNFENRSMFGEDMDKNLWLTFWATLHSRQWDHRCRESNCSWTEKLWAYPGKCYQKTRNISQCDHNLITRRALYSPTFL